MKSGRPRPTSPRFTPTASPIELLVQITWAPRLYLAGRRITQWTPTAELLGRLLAVAAPASPLVSQAVACDHAGCGEDKPP